MVDVRDAPYSGIIRPGTTDDRVLGRYMPFFCNDSYDMDDTVEATLSRGTCSLRAVTFIMGRFCSRTSSMGDIAAKRDKRTIVVIAVAKVRKNNFGF
jgi:hypothetical protein